MSWLHGHSKRPIPSAFARASIIAHRGFHDTFPENSLQALQAAAAEKYPIEFDIRCTKDGRLVVFHDKTLNRMTRSDGMVEDLVYSELKALRLWGRDGPSDQHIPQLADVLASVDTGMLVEIKESPKTAQHIVPLVVSELRRVPDVYDRVMIQSFSPQLLRHVRTVDPSFFRCQVFGECKWRDGHLLRSALRAGLLLNWASKPDGLAGSFSVLRKRRIARLQTAYGYAVFAWTAESIEHLTVAKELNVNAVVSDVKPQALSESDGQGEAV